MPEKINIKIFFFPEKTEHLYNTQIAERNSGKLPKNIFDFDLNFCESDGVWKPQSHKEVKKVFLICQDLTACSPFTWTSTEWLLGSGGIEKKAIINQSFL